MNGTSAFIREGLDHGEAVLVAVSAGKIEGLRRRLGRASRRVQFVDMSRLGRNPAAIIPAWFRFAEDQARREQPFRGIGEPIWAERSEEELVECERHEALLNVAFSGGPGWKLLCPYDITALPAPVVAEAKRNHPILHQDGAWSTSEAYPGVDNVPSVFDAPLPPVPSDAKRTTFDSAGLAAVRSFIRTQVHAPGVLANRLEDLVLAASEVAANAIVHGSGWGDVAVWQRGSKVVCEVRDHGVIQDPLAGRRPPTDDGLGGRGLWMANHLCDFVQIRNLRSGAVIRLHLDIG